MTQCSRVFPALVIIMISAGTVPGVMPPEHSTEMARRSKIKAAAIVNSVEILEITKDSTMKKVPFSLSRTFAEGVTEHFSGKCFSVDWSWQNPMARVNVFFYP